MTGIEYTIVLKRGAWGPEHAVVSPEDRDMIDKFRCSMSVCCSVLQCVAVCCSVGVLQCLAVCCNVGEL